jgi:MFS family permease
MAILSFGLFLLSRSDAATPLPQVMGTLAIVGLGVGLFTSPNSSAVMGAVPSDRRGVATGILSTARTLGGVLGIGLAGAIFTTVLTAAGDTDPQTVIHAVNLGLATASGIALLGAFTSATRPALDQTGGRPRRA